MRVERDDGEGGIFRAKFFDVVKALEIPGMDIDDDGVVLAVGEGTEKIGEGIDALDVKGCGGSVEERLRESRPGGVFAEEKDL